MQDSTNAAVNDKNWMMGSNFAAAPAIHSNQLPIMFSPTFFMERAVLLLQIRLGYQKLEAMFRQKQYTKIAVCLILQIDTQPNFGWCHQVQRVFHRNYRKFYEKDGVMITHSIDPATGFPKVSRLLSATILTEDCITAVADQGSYSHIQDDPLQYARSSLWD